MAKRVPLDIETYNKKRDFSKTKEPKGRKLKVPKGKGGDSFVVQKHDASRLHWDFRLELDGVLKSWAVPKGPSLDPGQNRLAMRTEDHPLDYGDFEGTIPSGEYGGGTVMLWDQGRWVPEPGKDPSKTIEEGHLHFSLEGERMKGEWVMFRLKPKPGEKAEPWMLKKVTDDYAEPDDGDALVDNCVTSVTTDRTMAEIAAGEDVWRSNRGGQKGGRAKKSTSKAPPPFEEPQLATLVDEVPTGNGWIHEYKYDGYRLLLAVGDGVATAWTRNGKDWSDKFKALVKAAAKLPPGCLLDGEAAALDDDGKPSFQLLQSTLKESKGANLVFYAFDLLIDRGKDIRKLPNIERKERLAALLEGVSPPILYGDHVVGRGEALFNEVCKQGGEGIVSKKADAPYRGTRTRCWLKVKCIQRQEFVIVGWSESDKRRGFRSLLLAAKEGGKLTYVGKVGTGFNAKSIDDLMERMEPLAVDKAPVEVPRADRKGAHFIKPQLVAEIAFTEFTGDGILRHPSFIALREDKPAAQVVVGDAQSISARRRRSRTRPRESFGIKLTNPERVIYPDEGLTKLDLANYYAAVEPLIMIDAAHRPMTLIRCPQGAGQEVLLPEARQRHVRRGRQARADQGEGRQRPGLSLFRRHQGPARLRADGHGRVPRLGQQGRQGRISRPAGVRSRPRRRPRLRQGERGGGAAEGAARGPRAQDLPAVVGRQGHPCRRSARRVEGLDGGEELRRALQPRHRRGRAGDVHRQYPQGAAAGPHLPRLAAQPARRDGGDALWRAGPRRRAGVGADRLGRARPLRQRPPFHHPRRRRASGAGKLEDAGRLGRSEAGASGRLSGPDVL